MFPDLSLLLLILWVGVAGVLYHDVADPASTWLLSRAFGRPPSLPADFSGLPFVCVVVSALDKEDVIGERIENALAAEYLADKYESVVASDRSTDRTAEIVPQFADPHTTLLDFPIRRGTPVVLRPAHEIADRKTSA